MGIGKSIFPLLHLIIFMTLSFNHSALSAEKSSGLVAPGATLKVIQSGFQGPEGPAPYADGNVYFSVASEERIYKWTWKDGKVSLYREKTGQALGLMFDAKGGLVMCELANGRITRDDMNGNITVLTDSCDGKRIYMPNDLWIDPKGGIYFTVFSFDKKTPAKELGVCYISPDNKKTIKVVNDIISPNGLIGTPDGKTIYIGDQNKIWSYKINSDGTLTNKKLFCEKNTDGMTIDEKNNVYLGEDSIFIYSPDGEMLEEIPTPEGVANFKFGGKDRKTLFITHRGGNIYTLEMAVRGALSALDLARGNK